MGESSQRAVGETLSKVPKLRQPPGLALCCTVMHFACDVLEIFQTAICRPVCGDSMLQMSCEADWIDYLFVHWPTMVYLILRGAVEVSYLSVGRRT